MTAESEAFERGVLTQQLAQIRDALDKLNVHFTTVQERQANYALRLAALEAQATATRWVAAAVIGPTLAALVANAFGMF